MRIAYLSQTYPPMVSGASIFAQRLAEGLAGRGHTVLVLTASDCATPYFLEKPHLAIQRFRSYPNPLRVDHRSVIWPHLEIMDALCRFSPDVLNTHDSLQWAISGLKFLRTSVVPGVLAIHALPCFISSYMPELPGIKRTVELSLWKYARWLVKQYDALVTPTQTISRLVTSATGVTPIVISGGVDLSIFSPDALGPQEEIALRNRFAIPPNVPIILYVGRLDQDKTVDMVVMAAARAMHQCNGHLLVVGNGTEKQNLQKLSRTLGIQSRSHFPGYISMRDGLPDIYRLASIFVTACEIETQGLVLLEAAACGLPIIAVDAAAIPELVKDRVNGLLSPPGDSDNLANNILFLLEHPNFARDMREASRIAAQEHSFERTLDSYEALYHSLVGSKKKNRAIVRQGGQVPFMNGGK